MLKNKITKKRKIAVVTGTRAEYGIFKPLLRKVEASKKLELKLLVTGMHLLKKYGMTIDEIKKDGFRINAKIPMYSGSDQDINYHGHALARGIDGFTRVFSKMKPDIIVVLGDRLESLVAVLAAATLGIPIAHIHGGDKTDSGHIDEGIRHSITRFAHIHFTATKKTKERLIKMGEEPRRVFKVGALGIDSIFESSKPERGELFKKFQLDTKQKLIFCIFHPVHIEYKDAGKQMSEVLKALKQLKIQSIVIFPNNDRGSKDIIKEINKYRRLPFINVFLSLNQVDYLNLLKQADVLIGNSSSGIIEAPALKLPVVNIGSRNIGREHGSNIILADISTDKILKGITKALTNKNFLNQVKIGKNPYGQRGVSNRITKILENIEIDKKLLKKKITY